MRWLRWLVVAAAVGIAVAALFVLLGREAATPRAPSEPAMDDIDAESRAAMRELLRDARDERTDD